MTESELIELDGFLEEAEFYLAEALQALVFPEAYGLEDPESRGKALRKLRKEIEVVQDRMNRARELSCIENQWLRGMCEEITAAGGLSDPPLCVARHGR